MNGMMIDIELLFSPVAADMGHSTSICPVPEGEGESPFIACLLGAFSGVGPAMENETSPDGGKSLPVFGMPKGIAWRLREDQPGSLQHQGSMAKDTGQGLQGNATEEVLGALPAEGSNTEEIETVGKVVKGPGDASSEASRGIWRGNGSADATGDAIPSSTESDKAVAGEIGKKWESLAQILKNPGDSASREAGKAVTRAIPNESEPTPEILRVPGNGVPVSLDPSPKKGQKSLLVKSPAASSPDEGRPLVREGLNRNFQNLVRRFHTTHGDSQMGREGSRVFLPDPSAPGIGQKRGMRGFVSIGEEVASSPTTQPLTSGESVIFRNRPLPLAEGFMQQILENLNVRTWKVGQKDLKIQLHPEEMGRLRMEIGMKNHQVVLKIYVENPLVKDLIENNLAQLREGLLDQGLKMDRCSVTVGDHFQHQSGGSGDNSPGTGNHGLSMDRGETEKIPPERISSSYPWDSDLVNLFV